MVLYMLRTKYTKELGIFINFIFFLLNKRKIISFNTDVLYTYYKLHRSEKSSSIFISLQTKNIQK